MWDSKNGVPSMLYLMLAIAKGRTKVGELGSRVRWQVRFILASMGTWVLLATVIVLSVGVDKFEEEFRKYLERTVYVGIFKTEIEAPLSRRNISSRRDGVVFGILGLVT